MIIKWDLKKSCMPDFAYRINNYGDNPTVTLQGSNDDSNWVDIGILKLENIAGLISSTTNCRYYRLYVQFAPGSSNTSGLVIYYMCFRNVPDVINAYRNNFISENDFEVQELKNVIVPSYSNAGYITENNVNGIPVEEILDSATDYKLRRIGDKLILDYTQFITGSFRASSSNTLYTIDVGFKPDLVLIYNAENNYSAVAGSDASADYIYVPRVLTNSYFSEYGGIVENGFTLNFSANSVDINYIAIRFWGVKM